MDSRNKKLAMNIICNSISLKPGDNLLVEITGEDGLELANEIIKQAKKINANPILNLIRYKELKEFLINSSKEKIIDFARKSNMTLTEFKNFYYNVCNVNYNKMKIAMEPLQKLMNKTDKVHIVAPGTDLIFSIKGIPAEKYYGTFNIPDGEVATCPIKDSVNGYITYNTKTKYNDIMFENIRFEFVNGKIVKATADKNTKELNQILDTDNGARYIGEFAFGLNPYINNTICDTLFDEKINGSFHFTPGMSLEKSDNGNRSAIHWDIVKILRKEFGGGKIYFDNVLINKDGNFVLDELKLLNAENLI